MMRTTMPARTWFDRLEAAVADTRGRERTLAEYREAMAADESASFYVSDEPTPRYVHQGETDHDVTDYEYVDDWGTARCQTCGELVAQNPEYEPEEDE